MTPRRPLLVLLLSLLIPLSGVAGMETDMGDCPLDGMSVDSAMAMQMQAMDHDHPCCNDAETVSRTGQLCKPGQECGTGFSLPAMNAGAGFSAAVNEVFLPITLPLLSGLPDELLRPPPYFLTNG